jgi:osmotically inducible protein OsmC
VLNNTSYDYVSRFADGTLTNPEELVAAAHGGCFAMKLSFVLGAAGFTPESLEAKVTVTLGDGVITNSHIELKAKVPGIDAAKFKECAEDAKANCPISKSLNAAISMDATLL